MLSRKKLAASARFLRNPERWVRGANLTWRVVPGGEDVLIGACAIGAYFQVGKGYVDDLDRAHREAYREGMVYYNDNVAKNNRDVCRRLISLGKGLPKGV